MSTDPAPPAPQPVETPESPPPAPPSTSDACAHTRQRFTVDEDQWTCLDCNAVSRGRSLPSVLHGQAAVATS